MPEPYFSTQLGQVFVGECIELMGSLPREQFDVVIADPPYMIGATSIGNAKSKSGTWADMENAAYWFAGWMEEAKKKLKPSGYLIVMGNWRSLPTLLRALSIIHWKASSCLVWDKAWIGPASINALRPRYEVCLFASMERGRIDNRSAPDIYRCKWMASHSGKTGHPAEKPRALFKYLISLVGARSALDPFLGSGTTAMVCEDLGIRWVGIEREEKYCAITKQRLIARAPLFT